MIYTSQNFKQTQLKSSSEFLRGRCFKNLIELVELDSPTRNIEGVFSVQKWVARELHNLGLTTQFIMHEKNHFAPMLVGFFHAKSAKTISLVMHADTVLDSQQYGLEGVNLEKGKLFGPGVIDNKGGIVIALEGLRMFLSHTRPQFNIQFVCVPNEELGSDGFRQQLSSLGKKSDLILGFEPAMNDGDIIHSRHGNRWYDITIQGIEAHSGRCQGEELNAAHEWAFKLVKILKLKDKYRNVKLNVGSTRSSKDKYNVVCGDVTSKLDFRFECNETKDNLHKDLTEILNQGELSTVQGHKCDIKFSIADDCPAFSEVDASKPYFTLLKKLIHSEENYTASAIHSGGASDVNYMSHKGSVCIDGLGAIGGGMHTNREYIQISSLKSRSSVLFHFLKNINNPLLKVGREFL